MLEPMTADLLSLLSNSGLAGVMVIGTVVLLRETRQHGAGMTELRAKLATLETSVANLAGKVDALTDALRPRGR